MMQQLQFSTIDSTNDEVLRRLEAGSPTPPFVVRADEQSAGRGRRGRAWFSPPGGLWMTVAWPPRTPPGAGAEAAALVTGLALAEAVETEVLRTGSGGSGTTPSSGPRLEIKWPNDLLLGRRKVAGILCERRMSALTAGRERADADAPSIAAQERSPMEPVLVIGVGVNVNIEAADLPRHLEFPADSLKNALGRPIAIDALYSRFLERFEEHMAVFSDRGFTPGMKDAISRRLAFLGEAIEVTVPLAATAATLAAHATAGAGDPTDSMRRVRGRVLGLDLHGRLIVEEEHTQAIHACHAGEVRALRPSG